MLKLSKLLCRKCYPSNSLVWWKHSLYNADQFCVCNTNARLDMVSYLNGFESQNWKLPFHYLDMLLSRTDARFISDSQLSFDDFISKNVIFDPSVSDKPYSECIKCIALRQRAHFRRRFSHTPSTFQPHRMFPDCHFRVFGAYVYKIYVNRWMWSYPVKTNIHMGFHRIWKYTGYLQTLFPSENSSTSFNLIRIDCANLHFYFENSKWKWIRILCDKFI